MAGLVSVCSSNRSFISRRPVRTAEAERSRSSEDGGVWTTSSSAIVRRARLSPGAVRTGTRLVLGRGAGAERGVAVRAGDFGAAVFFRAMAVFLAVLFALFLTATAFAARRGAVLRVGAFALRESFLALRRTLARADFFTTRLRPAALREADRRRAAPRREVPPFRRVARAALRFAIAGSFR